MAFPVITADGQTYVSGGVTYTSVLATNRWQRTAISATIANNSVTTNMIAPGAVEPDKINLAVTPLATPPGAPTVGPLYLITATATGAWAGKENQLATWDGTAWVYTIPTEGIVAWNDATDTLIAWNGTAWVSAAGSGSSVADGSITTVKLADGAVTTAKLADDSVTSAKIVDGTIATADLADKSVTDAKLADMDAYTIKMRNAGTAGVPANVNPKDFTADTAPAITRLVTTYDPATGEPKKSTLTELKSIIGGGGATVGSIVNPTVIGTPVSGTSTEVVFDLGGNATGSIYRVQASGLSNGAVFDISRDGGATWLSVPIGAMSAATGENFIDAVMRWVAAGVGWSGQRFNGVFLAEMDTSVTASYASGDRVRFRAPSGVLSWKKITILPL